MHTIMKDYNYVPANYKNIIEARSEQDENQQTKDREREGDKVRQ